MRGGMWLFNATSKFYTGVDLFDAETPATRPVTARPGDTGHRHRPDNAEPTQH